MVLDNNAVRTGCNLRLLRRLRGVCIGGSSCGASALWMQAADLAGKGGGINVRRPRGRERVAMDPNTEAIVAAIGRLTEAVNNLGIVISLECLGLIFVLIGINKWKHREK